MFLIAGLGNPGQKYLNTRHNIGFDMLDVVAAAFGAKVTKVKHKALVGECEICGSRVILAKPQTFMNLSGQSVREISEYYKINPEHIIVIYDEAALDIGRLRIRTKGSAGGHNGIKDIIYQLGSEDFVRVRVGMAAGDKDNMVDFVLSKLSKSEITVLKKVAAIMPELVSEIIKNGPESAMNVYNSCEF